MKYIFVSGGVISGIGKGIASASIGLLLKSAGYKVSIIKCDPYLNVDAGTMNPVIHGETFIMDDGSETDQDLGHYERFLNESLNKTNFTTSGQVYLSVIQRERNLEYDGECVEAVPHIPEEFIRRIQEAGKNRQADVVVIEIGGTVGELQNVFIFEANRLLKHLHPKDVIHIHVSYLPIPASLGEMKSKPAQMSVRELNSMGIQPDILLARSSQPVDASRRRKLSVFCNLEADDIFSAEDVETIYQVPISYDDQGLTGRILTKLGLKQPKKDLKTWRKFVDSLQNPKSSVKVAIVGKYFQTGDYTLADSYVSVIEALKHAGAKLGTKVQIAWVDAAKIIKDPDLLADYSGIIVPGGFGSRNIEGKIQAIRYAREHKIPFFGLCYGMQLACVEYARNVVGLTDANSTEVNPKTKHPIIHIMPDQIKKLLSKDYGASMRLGAWDCKLKANSLVASLYGQPKVSERHRHRYEFNNDFKSDLQKMGLSFVGTSPDGKLVEIIELPNHPFFVGTQFHPELKSRPLAPHPLFIGFVEAVSKYEDQNHPSR